MNGRQPWDLSSMVLDVMFGNDAPVERSDEVGEGLGECWICGAFPARLDDTDCEFCDEGDDQMDAGDART